MDIELNAYSVHLQISRSDDREWYLEIFSRSSLYYHEKWSTKNMQHPFLMMPSAFYLQRFSSFLLAIIKNYYIQ